jgi:hypothetical protein
MEYSSRVKRFVLKMQKAESWHRMSYHVKLVFSVDGRTSDRRDKHAELVAMNTGLNAKVRHVTRHTPLIRRSCHASQSVVRRTAKAKFPCVTRHKALYAGQQKQSFPVSRVTHLCADAKAGKIRIRVCALLGQTRKPGPRHCHPIRRA